MSVEEPAYRVRHREDPFEVRDYPTLVVAEVTVDGPQNHAASAGFKILASYIFGANARRESIAMTAPVTLIPTPGMRGRVAAQGTGFWVVRFTMPKRFAINELPSPKDARVQLRAAPSTRFAVARFTGVATPDAFRARAAELNAWIIAHHLQAAGPASLAQYDPPWTLWFLRRNEVTIPVST